MPLEREGILLTKAIQTAFTLAILYKWSQIHSEIMKYLYSYFVVKPNLSLNTNYRKKSTGKFRGKEKKKLSIDKATR